mmetsp:Transcript_71190/g.190957  ORF Transcript_71190/g.190957 Transcript_71190/m.190957 type:complete len:211 (-) Transcript_71190:138-770(-)
MAWHPAPVEAASLEQEPSDRGHARPEGRHEPRLREVPRSDDPGRLEPLGAAAYPARPARCRRARLLLAGGAPRPRGVRQLPRDRRFRAPGRRGDPHALDVLRPRRPRRPREEQLLLGPRHAQPELRRLPEEPSARAAPRLDRGEAPVGGRGDLARGPRRPEPGGLRRPSGAGPGRGALTAARGRPSGRCLGLLGAPLAPVCGACRGVLPA